MPSRAPRTANPLPPGADWHVALLRGVNVGGGKRVPMASLRAMAADIGFTGVTTLLNSGNLVYRTAGVSPSQAARLLHGAIANTLQVDCTVFVRTRDELGAIVADNPFVAEAEAIPSRALGNHITARNMSTMQKLLALMPPEGTT